MSSIYRLAQRHTGMSSYSLRYSPHGKAAEITALTIAELLETGRDSNDPLVAALRDELW